MIRSEKFLLTPEKPKFYCPGVAQTQILKFHPRQHCDKMTFFMDNIFMGQKVSIFTHFESILLRNRFKRGTNSNGKRFRGIIFTLHKYKQSRFYVAKTQFVQIALTSSLKSIQPNRT